MNLKNAIRNKKKIEAEKSMHFVWIGVVKRASLGLLKQERNCIQ